jgi:hypothetical protein
VAEIETKILKSDDPLLGRNIGHDPRSRAYPARNAFTIEAPQTVEHDLYLPVLDQDVGSCVLHTMTGLVSYAKHWVALTDEQKSKVSSDPEEFAENWYRWTSRNDEFAGAWEPDDTGTSGLSGAKCTVHHGYSKGYVHAFSFAEALGLLNHTPVGFGGWWYSSMDRPDSNGIIRVTSSAYRRGGHEWIWRGNDVDRRMILGRNSWSTNYGINGEMWIPWADAERLMSEDGDVVALIPNDLPAPEPDWDLMLAPPLKAWAYSRGFSKFTKAGKAAAASREWLTRKGL